MRVDILGVPFDNVTMEEAVAALMAALPDLSEN